MMIPRNAIAAWQRFGTGDLRRAALWGFAATVALLLVVFAATSQTGRSRLALTASKAPARQAQPPEDSARKLAAIVETLAADRERLAARLDTLERNVGEITGSIGRRVPTTTVMPSAPAAAPPLPAVTAPEPAPPVPPEPGRQEFGIDLGGAANVEALRTLWIAAKSKHGGLLEGLRPIIAIRERARPGGVELRLVAGPFGNAGAAARLCSVIAASGAICQPTPFEGQRLALH